MVMVNACIVGFICGFLLIPTASRLVKSFGWETPFRFSHMFHIIRIPKNKDSKKYLQYKALFGKMLLFCFLYAVIFSAFFGLLFYYMDTVPAIFTAIMAVVVALSGLMDLRIWILPDFFTVPLIISGLAVTYYFQPLTSMNESIVGCVFGYFMPLFVALLLQKRYENPIGGGDVKMMAGLGAWMGFAWFNVMLILSFATFAVFAFMRKSRVCPYGPPLTLAALIALVVQVVLKSTGFELYK